MCERLSPNGQYSDLQKNAIQIPHILVVRFSWNFQVVRVWALPKRPQNKQNLTTRFWGITSQILHFQPPKKILQVKGVRDGDYPGGSMFPQEKTFPCELLYFQGQLKSAQNLGDCCCTISEQIPTRTPVHSMSIFLLLICAKKMSLALTVFTRFPAPILWQKKINLKNSHPLHQGYSKSFGMPVHF